MLGQLTRQDQSDSSLDLSGGDGGLLVVGSQLGGLGGDSLEDVVHERVHDGHGLLGNTGVRVGLLQDLVDVGGVCLLSGLGSLLGVGGGGGLLAGWLLLGWCLGCYFLFCLWCHCVCGCAGEVGLVYVREAKGRERSETRRDEMSARGEEAEENSQQRQTGFTSCFIQSTLSGSSSVLVVSTPSWASACWCFNNNNTEQRRACQSETGVEPEKKRDGERAQPAHDLSSCRVNFRPAAILCKYTVHWGIRAWCTHYTVRHVDARNRNLHDTAPSEPVPDLLRRDKQTGNPTARACVLR